MSARAALWHLLRGSDDEDNLLIYLGLHFLNDRIHVTPYGHRCVGVLSTHAWGSRGRGNIVSGLDLHTCTHTSRWYADLLISYLRDVASDLLTRRMATRLLGGQLPEGARRAWATGGEQPAVAEAVMTEDVEKKRQQLAPGPNGGDRRAMQEGEAVEAAGGAEAEEGVDAEEGSAVFIAGGGGDGGGNTRCWAGSLVLGNCSVQGGMGRSYKVGGGEGAGHSLREGAGHSLREGAGNSLREGAGHS